MSSEKKMKCSLVVIKRNNKDGRRYVLDERNWCVLGSHQDCDIRIHSSGVGPVHALFTNDQTGTKLVGLCDDVPVMIPGRKKILYRNDGANLESGDKFFLGDRAFRLEILPSDPAESETELEGSEKLDDKENCEKLNTPVNKGVVAKKGAVTTPFRKKTKKASRRHSLVVSDRDEVFVHALKPTGCIPSDRLSVSAKEIAAVFAADSLDTDGKSSAEDVFHGQIGGLKINLDYNSSKKSKSAKKEKSETPRAASVNPSASEPDLIMEAVEDNDKHENLRMPAVEYSTPKRAQRATPMATNVFQRPAQRVSTPKRPLESTMNTALDSARRLEKTLQRATPQRSTPAKGLYGPAPGEMSSFQRTVAGSEGTPFRNPRGAFSGTPKRVAATVEETTSRVATAKSYTSKRRTLVMKGTPSNSAPMQGTPLRTPSRSKLGKQNTGKGAIQEATPRRSLYTSTPQRSTPARALPFSNPDSEMMGSSSKPARSLGMSGTPRRAVQMPEVSRGGNAPSESFPEKDNASITALTAQASTNSVPSGQSDVHKLADTVTAKPYEKEPQKSTGSEEPPEESAINSQGENVGLEINNLESNLDSLEKETPVVPDTKTPNAQDTNTSDVVEKRTCNIFGAASGALEISSTAGVPDTAPSGDLHTTSPIAPHTKPPATQDLKSSGVLDNNSSSGLERSAPGALETKTSDASEPISADSSSSADVPSTGHKNTRVLASKVNPPVPGKKESAFARLSAGLSALPKGNRPDKVIPQVNIDVHTMLPGDVTNSVRNVPSAKETPSVTKRANAPHNLRTPKNKRPVKPSFSRLPPRTAPRSRRTPLVATKSIQKTTKHRTASKVLSERKRGVLFNPVIELEAGSHYSPHQAKSGRPDRKSLMEDNTSRKLDLDMLPKPSPPRKSGVPGSSRFFGPPPSSPLARLGRFLYPKGPSVPLLMAPSGDDCNEDDSISPESSSSKAEQIPESESNDEEPKSNSRSSLGASVSNFLKRLSGAFDKEEENESSRECSQSSQESSRDMDSTDHSSVENGATVTSPHTVQLDQKEEQERDVASDQNLPSESKQTDTDVPIPNRPAGQESSDMVVPETAETVETYTPKTKKRLSLLGRVVYHAASVVADAVSPGGGLLNSDEESQDHMEVDVGPNPSPQSGPEDSSEMANADDSLPRRGSGLKRAASRKRTGSDSSRRKVSLDSLPFDLSSDEPQHTDAYKEDPEASKTKSVAKTSNSGSASMDNEVTTSDMCNKNKKLSTDPQGLGGEEQTLESSVEARAPVHLMKIEPSSETDSDAEQEQACTEPFPVSKSSGTEEQKEGDQNDFRKNTANASVSHDNNNTEELEAGKLQNMEVDAASEESNDNSKATAISSGIQGKSEEQESPPSFATWTVKQLQEFLRGLDVDCHGLRKAELVEKAEQVCASRNDEEQSAEAKETGIDGNEKVDTASGGNTSENVQKEMLDSPVEHDVIKGLLEKMTVKDLRKRLETMGLDTKGRKIELIERIIGRTEEVPEADIHSDSDEAVDDSAHVESTDVAEQENSTAMSKESDTSKAALKLMKVAALRERLESLGLDTKGKKSELVDRLYEAYNTSQEPQDIQAEQPEQELSSDESHQQESDAKVSDPIQISELESMTASDLRAKLADLGLDTRGRKSVLIDRLTAASSSMEDDANSDDLPTNSDEKAPVHVAMDECEKEEPTDRETYMAMTVKELRKLMETRGLEAQPKLRKANLVDYILENIQSEPKGSRHPPPKPRGKKMQRLRTA